MFIKLLTALTLFLLVNYMAVADSFSQFLDTASLAIVLGGAFAFAICGQGGLKLRQVYGRIAQGMDAFEALGISEHGEVVEAEPAGEFMMGDDDDDDA